MRAPATRSSLRIAACTAVVLAGAAAVLPSSLSSAEPLWVLVAFAGILAAVDGSPDNVLVLPWVAAVAAAPPFVVAVADPGRVWNVALAGLLVWLATECLALARTLARLDAEPPELVAARLQDLAPIAAGGAAAALGIVAVATVDPGGGLVVVGLAVLAALAYAGVARALRGD